MIKKGLVLIGFLFLSNLVVLSQRKPTESPKSTDKKATALLVKPEGPDSTIYSYTYRSDLKIYRDYSDTLLHRTDIYNPATESGNEHLTLGNQASAAIPFKYGVQKKLGIQYGYNQYNLYNYELDSIKLFKLNRPLNDLYFSPFDGQQNFIVKALFARQFSDGISLFIDYRRFNQEGLYNDQNTQTTNLSTTVLLEKPKYTGVYSLLVNTNNEINNGGIVDEEDFGNSFYSRRSNIDVNLSNANNRKEEYTLSMLHRYALSSKEDLKVDLKYSMDWERGAIRSSDTDVDNAQDSSYYDQFLVDSRGLRNAFDYYALANDIGLELQSKEYLNLKTGLKYTYHNADYNGLTENLNELILYGDLRSKYKNLGLTAYGELGLGNIVGDFDLKGALDFDSSFLKLKGGIRFYRHTPELKAQKLFINFNQIWDNDFAKPLGTILSAKIAIPSLKLNVTLNQIVENNTIFWNRTFVPEQLEDILTVTQVEATQRLKLGPLHLDHNLLFQQLSSDSIALPKLVLNQNLYLQFKLFDKKLETQLGAEGTYMSSYRTKSYMPLTATFGNTSTEITNYPMLTGYINLKIKKFRVFFRFENINTLWERLPYYHLYLYPQYDNNFRMGVRWLLTD